MDRVGSSPDKPATDADRVAHRPPSDAPAPAIVIVAYDRPRTLVRLLGSLKQIRIPTGEDVPLVISIDDSVGATMEVAHRYDWPFGPKRIIGHKTLLGLRAHVLACGDLTTEYGSIMMLEDDLYASPDVYRYAQAAATFYGSIDSVAGISTYAYRLDELLLLAFHPLDDGFDTLFMQMPSSWGQLWTVEQWARFRSWQRSSQPISPGRLPRQAAEWPPEKSWKRSFLEYLIDTDRYFAFPRASLTSNCGDAGEHFRRATINFTTPLAYGPRDWRFAPWSERAIRYDAWFEPHPDTIALRWPDFGGSDITVDLRGSKQPKHVTTSRLLSSRPSSEPDVSFPMLLQPEALNLDLPGQGAFFHLGPSSSFGELPPWKRRRMIEALNGEIGSSVARGILLDRTIRRLRRDWSDWRTE
ncbi:MAG: glycosyl transferase family 2 [Gammaproteobacteria bacterium]|nr:glycosyl transferase family 2 [Gammaproteobacteria bacterium]